MKGSITINVNVNLTFSKIMAFVLSVMVFILDLITTKNGAVMMFSIPFIVILVTGKQVADIFKQPIDKMSETITDTPEKTITETVSESTST